MRRSPAQLQDRQTGVTINAGNVVDDPTKKVILSFRAKIHTHPSLQRKDHRCPRRHNFWLSEAGQRTPLSDPQPDGVLKRNWDLLREKTLLALNNVTTRKGIQPREELKTRRNLKKSLDALSAIGRHRDAQSRSGYNMS